MNKITNVSINTSKLSSIAQRRKLTIEGDANANFMVTIVSSSTTTAYYNFNTNTFTGEFTTSNILKGTVLNGQYSTDIYFPASNNSTYTVQVLPDPENNTIIHDNSGAILKTISQVSNTTLTFSLASRSNPNNYKTFPADVVLTGNVAGGTDQHNFNYLIENAETDGFGFGLFFDAKLTQPVTDKSLYFTTTETVDGATSSSTTFFVDDVTDIGVGSVITAISGGGSLSGTPTVTSVDATTKEITINTAQTFPDGNTLTFVAQGPAAIFEAIGVLLKAHGGRVEDATLKTTTVRSGGSGDTVNVNGTYGIAGGSVLAFGGLDVDNSGNNNINVVTASETAGSFTCDTSQSLTAGTTLSFKPVDRNKVHCINITVSGAIDVANFPLANKTIYIDVDTFLSVGVSGA